jgi:glycerol uptake facilitator-like aquaporin
MQMVAHKNIQTHEILLLFNELHFHVVIIFQLASNKIMASQSSSLSRQYTSNHDLERANHDGDSIRSTRLTGGKRSPASQSFAIRIDEMQDDVLDTNDPKIAEIFKHPHDEASLKDWKTTKSNHDHDLERADSKNVDSSSSIAASTNLQKLRNAPPHLNWKELLDMGGFVDVKLWRYAGLEAIGTMLLTFVSAWVASHPPSSAPLPTSPSGIFGTAAFLGPLVGGISTWLLLMFLIYSLMATSGGHVNPMITFATFFGRLISLPRMILYVGSQMLGGALAGGALATAYGTADFAVGGCNINPSLVSERQAFAIEFMFSLTLIFVAFGVGLNPRQAPVFGPILTPFLIGLALGILLISSAFTLPGYEGAGRSSFLTDSMKVTNNGH